MSKIESGIGIGKTPLHNACNNGNLDIVKCLVEHGVYLCAVDQHANSLLSIALDSCSCRYRYKPEILEYFKEKFGPFPDDFEPDIFKACEKGDLESVKFIFGHCADFNAKDDEERTPI